MYHLKHDLQGLFVCAQPGQRFCALVQNQIFQYKYRTTGSYSLEELNRSDTVEPGSRTPYRRTGSTKSLKTAVVSMMASTAIAQAVRR